MFLSLRFVNVLTIYEILSLGTPESSAQTAPRSVQPFLHSSRQSIAILYNVAPVTSQNCHSHAESGPPSLTWFPWLTRVHNPNRISIGLAVFAWLTTDRSTDHATRSATIVHIYIRSTVMWPNSTREEVVSAPVEHFAIKYYNTMITIPRRTTTGPYRTNSTLIITLVYMLQISLVTDHKLNIE